MKNWLILTKVHLAGITGFNKLRFSQNKSEKRKAGLVIGLYALFGVLIIAFVCMYALMFAQIGLAEYVISLSFAVSSLITLVFTLMRGAHILFAVKDYDMLVSLPVKKSDIIISRLITSYLINFVFCALVTVPCAAVAFLYGTFSIERLIYTVIALIVSPLAPVVIADVFSTLIMALTLNMRHKAIFQTVFSAIAVMAVMAISALLSYAGNGGEVNIGSDTLEKMLLIYPPAWLLQAGMSGNGFYWIIVLLAANIALTAVFIAVLAKFYFKINGKLIARSSNGKLSAKSFKAGTSFSAMYKNEFSKMVSSSPYMLNSTVGLLLLIIFSIASIFFNPFKTLAEIPEMDAAAVNEMKYMVCLVFGYMLGMTVPTSASLSLEGSRRWIAFSLPVSSFKILMAKVLMSFTLSAATGVICATIMTFSLQLSAVQAVLMYSTVIAVASFTSLFGMMMNVKFPKYDWTSESAVIKRGTASTITVLAGILPPIALFMLGFMVAMPMAYIIAAFDVIYLLIAVICLICLKKTKLCDK